MSFDGLSQEVIPRPIPIRWSKLGTHWHDLLENLAQIQFGHSYHCQTRPFSMDSACPTSSSSGYSYLVEGCYQTNDYEAHIEVHLHTNSPPVLKASVVPPLNSLLLNSLAGDGRHRLMHLRPQRLHKPLQL